jgi:hypothetical protein
MASRKTAPPRHFPEIVQTLDKCRCFEFYENSPRIFGKSAAPAQRRLQAHLVVLFQRRCKAAGDTMGRVMFFLLRMAFWLCVVCVLLPGSGPKTDEARIDPATAVTAASAAVTDMRGFCDRQPEACVAGGKIAVALGHKAEAGARTIIEFVTNRMGDSAETPAGVPGAPATVPADRSLTTASTSAPARVMKPVPVAERGTLTASDLTVPWHGPAQAKQADKQAHVPLPPRRAARPSV